jgi:N utilization substance protein B
VSRSGEEALTGAAGGGVALSPAGAGLIHDVAVSDGDREKIRARVTAVVEAIPRLDARIREVAIGWTVGRIGKAELAILRLALYEMLFDPDIPEKVAVNEAVEIAKKYGGKDASAFINGVLSQFIFEEKG